MCRLLAGALAGLLALTAMSATAAAANAPQANGQILFARFDPLLDDNVICTVNPDGSHESQVLPLALGCRTGRPTASGSSPAAGPPTARPHSSIPTTAATACCRCRSRQPVHRLPGDVTRCRAACLRGRAGQTDPSLKRSLHDPRLRRRRPNADDVKPGGDDIPGDYAPQGKRVVFARFDQDGEPIALFVVKLDGTGLRQITPTRTIFSGGGGGNDWSPQGNEIVFSPTRHPDVRSSLWVVNADGSGLHELQVQGQPRCGGPIADPTARNASNHAGRPDGKKIVFGIFTAVAGRNIYTVTRTAPALPR